MRAVIQPLLLALALALSGCAQVLGPQTLTWSESDLNRMLEKSFPMDRRVMEVLDMKVSQPALQLLPASNRFVTDLHVQALDRLFGTAFHGRIAMESGLRYEPSDHTLRLVDVRLNHFSLDRDGTAPRLPLQRLGAALVETMLNDAVIHHVSEDKLTRFSQWGYQPQTVRITDRGLELTVVPKP